jgi:hypothetical protein
MKPPISSSVALTACGAETLSAVCRAWRGASSDSGPTSSADSAAGAVARADRGQPGADDLDVEHVALALQQRRRQRDQLRVVAVLRKGRLVGVAGAVQQLAVEVHRQVAAHMFDVDSREVARVLRGTVRRSKRYHTGPPRPGLVCGPVVGQRHRRLRRCRRGSQAAALGVSAAVRRTVSWAKAAQASTHSSASSARCSNGDRSQACIGARILREAAP